MPDGTRKLGGSAGGAPSQVGRFALGADVAQPGPGQAVVPVEGDPPVLVLVGPHVMIEVPRDVLTRPGRVEVRLAVQEDEPDAAGGHGGDEERGDRGQRQVHEHAERGGQPFLVLRVPAEEASRAIVAIVEAGAARLAVVLVPVERPEARGVLAQPVQDVAVEHRLDRVGVHQPDGNPDHDLTSGKQ
jgi:hypothetical protein